MNILNLIGREKKLKKENIIISGNRARRVVELKYSKNIILNKYTELFKQDSSDLQESNNKNKGIKT